MKKHRLKYLISEHILIVWNYYSVDTKHNKQIHNSRE